MPQVLRIPCQIIRYQGLRWLLFRAGYAAKLRLGWFRYRLPTTAWGGQPAGRIRDGLVIVRDPRSPTLGSEAAVARADRILSGWLTWFSDAESEVGFPPDWFANPCEAMPRSSAAHPSAADAGSDSGRGLARHWSQIGEFSAGDIKGVWEQARFGFVFPIVRAFARNGDDRYVEVFWKAIEDWREKNPPQSGVHWKCGQEISLRIIAWTFGFLTFRSHPATTCTRAGMLAEMLDVAGCRIEANIDYAVSQNNNHATSEATGLFTAGVLLGKLPWVARGRKLLESLSRTLIYNDGSFSQHSTNYHRLMLHTYLWAIRLGATTGYPLSAETVNRVRLAGTWLRALMCPVTGRVPNLGPNDGAHLFDLTDLEYLDYRPTIQAVGLATEGIRWLQPGPWDELSDWLERLEERRSVGGEKRRIVAGKSGDSNCRVEAGEDLEFSYFPDGGYALWRRGSMLAVLRCPRRFRHRPTHCDVLHFDLWHEGRNLLRDSGSYCYHCEKPWQSYFPSAAAHNTIQFDDRDPMPRLSRFLYGSWPKCDLRIDGQIVSATYCDYCGAMHRRIVRPTRDGFEITDQIGGAFKKAVLRWRLDSGCEWELSGLKCVSKAAAIHLSAESSGAAAQIRLAEGWESLYYRRKSPLSVLELQVDSGCREIRTEIQLERVAVL